VHPNITVSCQPHR